MHVNLFLWPGINTSHVTYTLSLGVEPVALRILLAGLLGDSSLLVFSVFGFGVSARRASRLLLVDISLGSSLLGFSGVGSAIDKHSHKIKLYLGLHKNYIFFKEN
jgi:arginine exporter protein ArgO